ncbi:DedA family protein [Oceanithermus sp.]
MSPLEFAEKASYLGSATLLFLETGALVGLVVPGGDSLVLALGVLAGLGRLDPFWLWFTLTVAVVLGQWSGYFWGWKSGAALLRRVDPAHLERARRFLARYGRYAVLLAPFVPVVRTLTPFLAGAGGVPVRRYAFWSALAAFLWIGSLLALGYYATGWALRILAGI